MMLREPRVWDYPELLSNRRSTAGERELVLNYHVN